MADESDEQDYFGGLGWNLLGKTGVTSVPNTGLGAALTQGLPSITQPQAPSDRLLMHLPTFAPPALGDGVPPVAATAGNKTDGLSQAIGQSLVDARRPDLGVLGNTIRSILPEGFSKDVFDNYMLQGGDFPLSQGRFNDIADIAAGLKPAGEPVQVMSADGEPLIRRQYRFNNKSPEYKYALGTASLFYTPDGNPVGFYDDYDFDPSSSTYPKDRSRAAEAQVRIMHGLEHWDGGKPFPIYYGQYVPTN